MREHTVPYCIHCGNEVLATDRFCRRCGKNQPGGAFASPEPLVSPHGAAILCYIPWLGWIGSLYALSAERFRNDREVRFHAYQGLYLFVAWMVVHWVAGLWFGLLLGDDVPVGKLLELGLLVVWIFMLVKTANGQRYSLPVIGEIAERSLQ